MPVLIHVLCNVQEYLKLRTAHVNSLKAIGDSPYPHKFVVTISLSEFIDKYGDVSDGEQHPDVVSVAGVTLSRFIFYFCLLTVDILMLMAGLAHLNQCNLNFFVKKIK